MDDEYPGPGGVRLEDIGVVFKGVRAGGVDFWGRDMGLEPLYGAVPGKLPAQGRATTHREAAEGEGGGYMGVSSAGGSNGGKRV